MSISDKKGKRDTEGARQREVFAKRAPYLYRLAVITVFKEKYLEAKNNPNSSFGSVSGLIQEFSSYGKIHPDNLKGSFSKKLGNIFNSDTLGARVEDLEHFEHIEEFVWKYHPEEISSYDLFNELVHLGKFISTFYHPKFEKYTSRRNDLDIGYEKIEFGPAITRTWDLGTIDDETKSVFKLGHRNTKKTAMLDQLKKDRNSSNLVDTYYLAVKQSRLLKQPIAILFSNTPESELCMGCYFKDHNLLVLKKYSDSTPVFLEYFSNTEMLPYVIDMNDHTINFKSNADISPSGISSPHHQPSLDMKIWNFSSFSRLSESDEKDSALNKANRFYDSLRDVY